MFDDKERLTKIIRLTAIIANKYDKLLQLECAEKRNSDEYKMIVSKIKTLISFEEELYYNWKPNIDRIKVMMNTLISNFKTDNDSYMEQFINIRIINILSKKANETINRLEIDLNNAAYVQYYLDFINSCVALEELLAEKDKYIKYLDIKFILMFEQEYIDNNIGTPTTLSAIKMKYITIFLSAFLEESLANNNFDIESTLEEEKIIPDLTVVIPKYFEDMRYESGKEELDNILEDNIAVLDEKEMGDYKKLHLISQLRMLFLKLDLTNNPILFKEIKSFIKMFGNATPHPLKGILETAIIKADTDKKKYPYAYSYKSNINDFSYDENKFIERIIKIDNAIISCYKKLIELLAKKKTKYTDCCKVINNLIEAFSVELKIYNEYNFNQNSIRRILNYLEGNEELNIHIPRIISILGKDFRNIMINFDKENNRIIYSVSDDINALSILDNEKQNRQMLVYLSLLESKLDDTLSLKQRKKLLNEKFKNIYMCPYLEQILVNCGFNASAMLDLYEPLDLDDVSSEMVEYLSESEVDDFLNMIGELMSKEYARSAKVKRIIKECQLRSLLVRMDTDDVKEELDAYYTGIEKEAGFYVEHLGYRIVISAADRLEEDLAKYGHLFLSGKSPKVKRITNDF